MENNIEERVKKLETAISTLIHSVQGVNSLITDGFLKVNENFRLIDEKFRQVDENFRKIDEKFNKIDEKFKKIDESFKLTNEKIDSIRGGSTSSLHTVEEQLSNLTTEISKINDVTKYGGIFDNMKVVNNDAVKKNRR